MFRIAAARTGQTQPGACGAPGAGPVGNGFTLLELLVTLVIIGLALALVAPQIGAGGGIATLDRDARSLVGGLRLAREEAILRGTEVAFRLEPKSQTWSVGGTGSSGRLTGRHRLTATVDAESADRGAAIVVFQPDGSSGGGTFDLASEDAKRTVAVDWLTGRVALR